MKKKEYANEYTNEEFEVITHNAERSALEEGIAHNEKLRERLNETKQLIADSCCEVVDAMGVAYDAKNEHLTKLREYRMTVSREVSDIAKAMTHLKDVATDKRIDEGIKNLGQFLELCEKLKRLEESGFLRRVLSQDDTK